MSTDSDGYNAMELDINGSRTKKQQTWSKLLNIFQLLVCNIGKHFVTVKPRAWRLDDQHSPL